MIREVGGIGHTLELDTGDGRNNGSFLDCSCFCLSSFSSLSLRSSSSLRRSISPLRMYLEGRLPFGSKAFLLRAISALSASI